MQELIPLNKLQLSANNVRKTHDSQADEQLSHDIEARGLLQNLIVTKAKKRGHFDVIAGGRRLRAMTMIVERGAWDADRAVPCMLLVASDAEIAETSLAENFQRLAMLGHVSEVSFDERSETLPCLFQAARSAYPKSWRRAAWNKHLRQSRGQIRRQHGCHAGAV